MGAVATLNFILSHPLNQGAKISAFFRFVKWQIHSRLNGNPVIYPFTEKSRLVLRKGLTGATGNLYCGLHEYADMAFLLHFLRSEDFFADIGANVGSYTVLASAHVGATTFAFEPVPAAFAYLEENISLNQIWGKVTVFNSALGAQKGSIRFTHLLDSENRVALPEEADTITVSVDTLDAVLPNGKIPILLKIDVEGYETEVLKGAEKTLSNPALKAIIIEINGSGKKYGYEEREIHQKLLQKGFLPYQYIPEKRSLMAMESFGPFNTLYVRDVTFIKNRLLTAETIKILGRAL